MQLSKILVALSCLALLSGCGGGGTTTSSSSSSSSSSGAQGSSAAVVGVDTPSSVAVVTAQ